MENEVEIELALVPNSSKVKIIQLVLVPNSRKTQIFRLVFHLDSASSSYLASWNSTSWKFTTLVRREFGECDVQVDGGVGQTQF